MRMVCLAIGCPGQAVSNSNYCPIHQPVGRGGNTRELYKNGMWAVAASPLSDGSVRFHIVHYTADQGYSVSLSQFWIGYPPSIGRGFGFWRKNLKTALRQAVEFCDKKAFLEQEGIRGVAQAGHAIEELVLNRKDDPFLGSWSKKEKQLLWEVPLGLIMGTLLGWFLFWHLNAWSVLHTH